MTEMEYMDIMKTIDIKSITAKTIDEVGNMPLEERGGFFNRHMTRINVTPELIREKLLGGIWEESIRQLNAQYEMADPLAAEKALTELMRTGAVKDRIVYRKESFRLELRNAQYRAYRNTTTGAACVCPWPSEKKYEVRIPGKLLASFMLLFDAEIPEIVAHIPDIMGMIRERERVQMKEQMEKELKEKVLQSLIEQYLKPLGLSVHSSFKEGDMVSLDIRQVRSARLTMPLWQLLDKLKDPAAVMDSLQPEPAATGFIDFEDPNFIP